MTALDPLDEQKTVRLRQRLWGAAVLIALLVIFLPLLLDGSGSESQYRRVERLRAEPPRILDEEGIPEADTLVTAVPQNTPVDKTDSAVNVVEAARGTDLPTDEPEIAAEEPVRVAEARPAQVPVAVPRQKPAQQSVSKSTEPLTAWVVQAGSFGDEANALAVRDKLRRAGFPSFVTPTDTATPMYRVRVGPMINLQQAEANRNKVVRLLDREAIVVSYP